MSIIIVFQHPVKGKKMKKLSCFNCSKIALFLIALISLPLVSGEETKKTFDIYCAFNGIIDDSKAATGYESSIAIDAQNGVHISYFDATNGDLKYIRRAKNGELIDNKFMNSRGYTDWVSFTIDSRGVVGKYTCIKVDSQNRPCISYYDATNKALKYAYYDNQRWVIQYVDVANVGMYTSLVLDKNDRPSISYYDSKNKSLKYARYDGFNWNTEEVDRERKGDLGLYTSLALGSYDQPRIAYYDNGNGRLKFAKFQGQVWDIEEVDAGEESKVGFFASLALGQNDTPYIAYYDVTKTALKFAMKRGNSWEKSYVDREENVGQFASLALDGFSNPKIAYYAAGTRKLKMAERRSSKWFTGYPIAQNSSFGMDCSLALDKTGNWYVSYREIENNKISYANSWPVDAPPPLPDLFFHP